MQFFECSKVYQNKNFGKLNSLKYTELHLIGMESKQPVGLVS